MNCNFDVTDYSIELIQGDYGSYVYTILDENGSVLENVKAIVFTCSRLKVKQELLKITDSIYSLTLPSELTETFAACTCTYDITIEFNSDSTPHTVVYNANFTILKKENKLNE